MGKSWKDICLQSSLPLEFEVMQQLRQYSNVVAQFGYTYLKENENHLTTEFSYDIDASYITNEYYIDLMIECKYRHNSVKWLFIPEEYGGYPETLPSSMIHVNDYFVSDRECSLRFYDPTPIGPLCEKGVEILSDKINPATITHAVNQLAYAIAEAYTSGIHQQISQQKWNEDNPESVPDFGTTLVPIHCAIPIIVTTADLYRLNPETTIKTIKEAESIEEVASKHTNILLRHSVGPHLLAHNEKTFSEFINNLPDISIESFLNPKYKDFPTLATHLSKHLPECILIVQHSDNTFEDIFNFIDAFMFPSEEIKEKIARRKRLYQSHLKGQ